MYVMITNGDPDNVWACTSEEDMLFAAWEHVGQAMHDQRRHRLPDEADDHFCDSMDIKVYKLGNQWEDKSYRVVLPFGKWLQEFKDGLAEEAALDVLKARFNHTVKAGLLLLKQQVNEGRRAADEPPMLSDDEIDRFVETFKPPHIR